MLLLHHLVGLTFAMRHHLTFLRIIMPLLIDHEYVVEVVLLVGFELCIGLV